MDLLPITRRIQHVQRYAQILEVLGRHGFAGLSQQLGIDSLIERGRAVLGGTPKEPCDRIPLVERVRLVLQELGPTFVKLGQLISTRPDLAPAGWAEEFKKLQNQVPGVGFDVVRKRLDQEFPDGLMEQFEWIEEKPLAAGSIAQIHRARLSDGTAVVLKILRPDIRRVIDADMEILRTLAEFLEGTFAEHGFSPTEVVGELSRKLKREVDLMNEGRATERLGALFDDDPEIVIPKVYWDATTHDVLALEELTGSALANVEAAQLSREVRRKLVENAGRAVFRQCLEFGFFHADPHPGNLIVLPKGRLGLIDFGLVGQIDARTARDLADVVAGIVSGDLDRTIAAAGAITSVGPEKLEDRSLRADVHAIVSAFQGTPLERLNLGQVLQDVFSSLRVHRIRCPADIVLLVKSLTTIESVARALDPSFELIPFVRPQVEELVARRYGASAVAGRLQRSLLRYLELAEDLPGEIRPILSQLRKNRLGVNLEHRGLDRFINTIEHASRNISFALIVASMFVGSSILVLAARGIEAATLQTIGLAGIAVSVALIILIFVSNRRPRGD